MLLGSGGISLYLFLLNEKIFRAGFARKGTKAESDGDSIIQRTDQVEFHCKPSDYCDYCDGLSIRVCVGK